MSPLPLLWGDSAIDLRRGCRQRTAVEQLPPHAIGEHGPEADEARRNPER
jgi:hypothetical protein